MKAKAITNFLRTQEINQRTKPTEACVSYRGKQTLCLHKSKFYDASSCPVAIHNSVAVLKTNSMHSW